MRIIAGQRRGHKIDGPRTSAQTRPTSDMVRESLFNILGGLVADRLVIDLFAGTGALGLEALSRGAERAIFVERDRGNVGLILRNIATLRYEDRTMVRLADAYRWARSFQPAGDRPFVAFLDPPYREYASRAGRLNQLITHLVEIMPPGSSIALEAGRILDAQILPEFETWDIRHYGETRIAIRVAAGAPAAQPPEGNEPSPGAPQPEAATQPEASGDE
jgi:16S rRNA (guanine966-N2)-methyltransferase